MPAPKWPDVFSDIQRAMRGFPTGHELTGVSDVGAAFRARVVKTHPETLGELGFPTLSIEVPPGTAGDGALVATRSLGLAFLKRESTTLDAGTLSALQTRAEVLWTKHIQERAADEQPKGFRLGAPVVERVPGVPGIVTVQFPTESQFADTETPGSISIDDRGQMFFIYSMSRHRIVFSTFGHPEWSPSSEARFIRPRLFFRVGKTGRVLFLGVSDGGWESHAYGIFDLATGRELIRCW